MPLIRQERPNDIPAVRGVNQAAFGQPDEGAIVDALRTSCAEALSLVAEEAGAVVGHIMFSPVSVAAPGGTVYGMGLAPMAVAPSHQRRGIGSALVNAGLKALTERGCPFVIVLGHADYYPRFGFVSASTFGLECQWPGIPDGVFMALVLDQAAMVGITGVARYRQEFGS